MRGWSRHGALPDTASVNAHEDGAEQVADALLSAGVGVEAGLWTVAAARAWRRSTWRTRCVRVLVELPDEPDPERLRAQAAELLALVGRDVPVLLHGEGASAWPALLLARQWGLATRTGLEDVLVLPDGSPAAGNAALVRAARELLERPLPDRRGTAPPAARAAGEQGVGGPY